jgi:hypothetical protein
VVTASFVELADVLADGKPIEHGRSTTEQYVNVFAGITWFIYVLLVDWFFLTCKSGGSNISDSCGMRKRQPAKEKCRIFEMKFLPPGRGLWAMGSPITEDFTLA